MRLNIQYKITVIIVFISACIFFGVFIYLNKNLQSYTYRRIESNLLKEARLSRLCLENFKNLPLTVTSFDPLADQIGADLQVRATIIDHNGLVLGDSELDAREVAVVENHLYRQEVQEAISAGVGKARRFSTTIKKDMLYLAVPFERSDGKGFIRLAIPLSELEIVSDRLKNILVGALGLSVVLSVLLGVMASHYLAGPLKQISANANAISRGDFSQRIYVRPGDEISDLANSFNFMSEQIKARIDEVEASKSRFEAILLSMFEGVMVIDEKGMIMLMNETLKKLLRIETDPVGRKPLEVVRNIEIQEIVDKVLTLKKGVTTKEISILFPEEKVFQVHATAIIQEDFTLGAVIVFHDITELRRLENVRRDFVANVSHELRTPITNIKGYTETLLEGAIDDKKNAREFLEIINLDSQRLAQLVEDLLDLSKIESGKIPLTFKPCQLKDIINRVLLGFRKQINDKELGVSIEIPSDLPKINVDEKAIAHVFLNLIDNAIKYNIPQGSLTINAYKRDKWVVVEIKDTGIGVPPEDCKRIFERFYRVDKARSRELGGTGLGLSIAKHIVVAHQGEISVESTLQQGSIFRLTLPTV